MALVERFMLGPARTSFGREDFPQFGLEAVHEALVNAVAHRDYSLSGSRIRLFLYADRLDGGDQPRSIAARVACRDDALPPVHAQPAARTLRVPDA